MNDKPMDVQSIRERWRTRGRYAGGRPHPGMDDDIAALLTVIVDRDEALVVSERAREEAERELAAAESEITSLLGRNAYAVALIERITGHDYDPNEDKS